jgi:hypothetical protein
METNDVRVAAVGAAAWAVALIVLLLVGLPRADRWWVWVCLTGIAIGLFGVWYIPRLQRSRAELLASHTAQHGAVPGPQPGQEPRQEHGQEPAPGDAAKDAGHRTG